MDLERDCLYCDSQLEELTIYNKLTGLCPYSINSFVYFLDQIECYYHNVYNNFPIIYQKKSSWLFGQL